MGVAVGDATGALGAALAAAFGALVAAAIDALVAAAAFVDPRDPAIAIAMTTLDSASAPTTIHVARWRRRVRAVGRAFDRDGTSDARSAEPRSIVKSIAGGFTFGIAAASSVSVAPTAAQSAADISSAERCRSYGRFESARAISVHKRGSMLGSGSSSCSSTAASVAAGVAAPNGARPVSIS